MSTLRTIRSRSHLMFGVSLLALAALAGSVSDAQAQAPVQTQAPARATPLDQILKEVSSYDGGIDSAALWKLREYVYARRNDRKGRAECEARLLGFLKSTATPAARMAAARLLRVIGSNAAVPALQAMLADDRLADMALYVLHGIPGAAAEDVLLQAVKSAGGATKNAVIAALGERRAAAAVPSLGPLLQQPAFSGAAAIALGRIGGDAAATELVAAYPGAPAELKPGLAASMLVLADTWLVAKNTGAARRIYELLSPDTSLPIPLRRAATIGRIPAAGTGAGALIADLLLGSDPVMQEAAIARIADVMPPGEIDRVSVLLPRLPEGAQVQLLAVLAGYPGERVLPAVREAARSSAEPVRLAALRCLETTGDALDVPLLAEAAARARGQEQIAARSALGMLKGRAVDEAILALLAQKPPDDVQRELLLSIADRRIYLAKPAVSAALTSGSPRIRVQAFRTLRAIGTPSDIPAVLDALLQCPDELERAEAEQTTAALARKIANPDQRSSALKARLAVREDPEAGVAARDDPEARARVIAVLPLIGDRTALPLLRSALDDRHAGVVDAAVRALTAWPTSDARDDIMRLARDSKNDTHRLLAIRGLVRSVGLEAYRDPESAVSDLKVAAALSSRPEEQKLVLGALSQFPCKGALDVATAFLKEPSVKAEAQAALDTIRQRLPKKAPGR